MNAPPAPCTPAPIVARLDLDAFERDNPHSLGLVLRLAPDRATRTATFAEFFLACVSSNTDNIQANLCYPDYARLDKEEDRHKRVRAHTQPTGEARP
jgi:hypothetical protein